MKYTEINKEVYYLPGPLVQAGDEELEFLKRNVKSTGRKRIRLCAHRGESDRVHQMLILLERETYIRPAKHARKAESMHVIEGRADAVFFTEAGEVSSLVRMGAPSTGLQFFYRMDEPIYHTLVIHSDCFVFMETTNGPLVREDTAFAPWSPEESDHLAVQEYKTNLLRLSDDFAQVHR